VGVAYDRAGNSGIGTTQFTVRVTYESLRALTRRFAASPDAAAALNAHLDGAEAADGRGDASGRTTALAAYAAAVSARSGLALKGEEAEILLVLADAL
jgi:hypothetical protein